MTSPLVARLLPWIPVSARFRGTKRPLLWLINYPSRRDFSSIPDSMRIHFQPPHPPTLPPPPHNASHKNPTMKGLWRVVWFSPSPPPLARWRLSADMRVKFRERRIPSPHGLSSPRFCPQSVFPHASSTLFDSHGFTESLCSRNRRPLRFVNSWPWGHRGGGQSSTRNCLEVNCFICVNRICHLRQLNQRFGEENVGVGDPFTSSIHASFRRRFGEI